MSNVCINPTVARKDVERAFDTFTEEQLNRLGLFKNMTEAQRNGAIDALTELVVDHAGFLEEKERDELYKDANKMLAFFEEHLKDTIPVDKWEEVEEQYNNLNATFERLKTAGLIKAGKQVFDINSEEAQTLALNLHALLVINHGRFMYKVKYNEAVKGGRRKIESITWALKTPVKSIEKSAQQKAIDRLEELKSKSPELVDWRWKEKEVEVERGREVKKYTIRYKEYRINGVVVKAIPVTSAYLQEDDTDFPALSGPLGTVIDEIGRDFFKKDSFLWKAWKEKEGWDDSLLQVYINTYKKGWFTVEGLKNLLSDFQVLEEQIKAKWGSDVVFFTDKLLLAAKRKNNIQIRKSKDSSEAIDSGIQWTVGEPDLLVVDKRGITHVIDFKSIKMQSDPLNYQQSIKDDTVYKRDVSYGSQITSYCGSLQYNGINTDMEPWIVVVDTYYNSADFGDKTAAKKRVYVKKKIKEGGTEKVVWEIITETNDEGNVIQTIPLTSEGRSARSITEVRGDAAGQIVYMEPRLHVAIESNKATEKVDALKGQEEGFVKWDEAASYEETYNRATPEERAALEDLAGKPVKRAPVAGITRISRDSLFGRPELITTQEIQECADLLMYAVYKVIDDISKGGRGSRNLQFAGRLGGKSHEEIINIIGIGKIIEAVWKDYSIGWDNYFPTWEEVEDERIKGTKKYKRYQGNKEFWETQRVRQEKRNWLFRPEHKDALLALGSPRLMALEKCVYVKDKKKNTEAITKAPETERTATLAGMAEMGDDALIEDFVDKIMSGHTIMEAWIMGARHFSPRVTLAQEIRGIYETTWQKERNKDGIWEPKVNSLIGCFMPINAKQAIETTRETVKNCETYKEMRKALLKLAKSDEYVWVLDILKKVDADKNLQKKFFINFRKDSLTYSVSSLIFNKKTGEQELVTRVINRKSAYDTMKHSLGVTFMQGSVGLFKIGKTEASIIERDKTTGRNVFTRTNMGGRPVNIIDLVLNEIDALENQLANIYSSNNIRIKKGKDESVEDYIIRNLKEKDSDNRTLLTRLVNILHGIGILIPEQTVIDACIESVGEDGVKESTIIWDLLRNARGVIDMLKAHNKKDGIPVGLAGNKAYKFYEPILAALTNKVQEDVEASTYFDGKTWYSYSNPSQLEHIIRNLKNALKTKIGGLNKNSKFNRYMRREFGRYRGWFTDNDGNYLCDWLAQFTEADDEARNALDHKVEISFIGNQYEDLGSLGFLQSILANYTGSRNDRETNSRYRWFAMPTMSNKPTNEFIRMLIYDSNEDIIERVLMNTFKQEMNRIADVLYHFTTPIVATQNLDITTKALENAGYTETQINELKEHIRNKTITVKDLNMLSKVKSGAKFHFLWYLNAAFAEEENSETAQGVVTMLNKLLTSKKEGEDSASVAEDTITFRKVKELIAQRMEKVVNDELEEMKKVGIMATEFRNGEEVCIYQRKLGTEYWGTTKEDFEDRLKKFIWQSIAANINIIQITGVDLALFGDSVNYQKRIAQLHSPGTHVMSDEDFDDGHFRSVHIEDDFLISDLLEKSEVALNDYMDKFIVKAGKGEDAIESYKNMISLLMGMLRKGINTTDGQSLNSPTSIRKKLNSQGKWTTEMQEAYDSIREGNFNLHNFEVLLQAQKPFVSAHIAKWSGSPTMDLRKISLQDKNSEFLIILAEALAEGAEALEEKEEEEKGEKGEKKERKRRRSKLAAISKFMEKSAELHPKQGIDTVHFHSVGKVGVTGVISMKEIDEEFERAKERREVDEDDYNEFVANKLLEKIERPNDKITELEDECEDLSPEERVYNNQYVDTITFEEYIIQQEAPVHSFGDERLFGSQIRILGVSDITEGTMFRITPEEEMVDDTALLGEYKGLIASNINASFDSLMERMGLKALIKESKTDDRISLDALNRLGVKERNKIFTKLRDLLQKELSKDMRYGLDLRWACELEYDTNGNVVDFVVPLSDPMQSNRVQMLLSSIIKKAINKQNIRGISLIQTTGYDRRLNIVFQSNLEGHEGEELLTLKQFTEKTGKTAKEFKQYLRDNKASIKHYECLMPVPDPRLEALITKEDGSLMSIKEIMATMPKAWEAISRSIGYRIPTEDKYSMMPLKIVGFLPRASGQSIMLPQEITYITNADFDYDKVYIMLKTLGAAVLNDTHFNKILKRFGLSYGNDADRDSAIIAAITKIFNNAQDIMNDSNTTRSLWDNIEEEEKKLSWEAHMVKAEIQEVEGENGEKLKKTVETEDLGMVTFTLKDVVEWVTKLLMSSFEEHKNMNAEDPSIAKVSRDNRILDIQWAVLTHEDTLAKMLNPGNFLEIDKIALISEILDSKIINKETGKVWTVKELKKAFNEKGEEYLSSMLESSNPHNTTLPTSTLYFQRQNMQGTQMVGIFANNNVSHAFLSHQRIAIDLNQGSRTNNRSFIFCGVEIGNINNPIYLDPVRGFDGQLISKTIACFLEASVDTAKNPRLDKINVNTFTGNVAMVLARLGFDITSIGLFLSQPIIRRLSDLYFQKSTDGYYNGNTAIKELAKEIGLSTAELNNTEGIRANSPLTIENFEEGKSNVEEGKLNGDFQKRVLKAFNILFQMSKDFQDITFCTKYNSVTNAGGPTIGDTLEDKERVENFLSDMKNTCFHVPNKNEELLPGMKGTERIGRFSDPRKVIANDEILKAFYGTTIGTGSASDVIFGCFFPHYWPSVKMMLKHFQKNYTKKDRLDARLRNKLVNDYLYFLLTLDDKQRGIIPTLPHSKEDIEYLVKDIITNFQDIIKMEGLEPNMIIDQGINKNCLRIREKDEYFKEDLLVFGSGQLDNEQQQAIRNAWTDLIQSPIAQVRRFGVDLFFYMLMRNGFNFSPRTMMHLASVLVRQNAQFDVDGKFQNYISGLRNLINIDDDITKNGFNDVLISRFCDQFVRNNSQNTTIIPNIKASHVAIDISSIREGVISFEAEENEDYKIYQILINKNPIKFITVTGQLDGRLYRHLYMYDEKASYNPAAGKRVLRYRKVEELGLVNNFIEYNANDDLDNSYFTPIRGDVLTESEDNIEDNYVEYNRHDPETDYADGERDSWAEISQIMQDQDSRLKGASSTAIEYRKKLKDAYQKAQTGLNNLAEDFNRLLHDIASRQETTKKIVESVLGQIQKVENDNDKC